MRKKNVTAIAKSIAKKTLAIALAAAMVVPAASVAGSFRAQADDTIPEPIARYEVGDLRNIYSTTNAAGEVTQSINSYADKNQDQMLNTIRFQSHTSKADFKDGNPYAGIELPEVTDSKGALTKGVTICYWQRFWKWAGQNFTAYEEKDGNVVNANTGGNMESWLFNFSNPTASLATTNYNSFRFDDGNGGVLKFNAALNSVPGVVTNSSSAALGSAVDCDCDWHYISIVITADTVKYFKDGTIVAASKFFQVVPGATYATADYMKKMSEINSLLKVEGINMLDVLTDPSTTLTIGGYPSNYDPASNEQVVYDGPLANSGAIGRIYFYDQPLQNAQIKTLYNSTEVQPGKSELVDASTLSYRVTYLNGDNRNVVNGADYTENADGTLNIVDASGNVLAVTDMDGNPVGQNVTRSHAIPKNGVSQSSIPTKSGKVFAGWYTDETYTTPYMETTGNAYAKWVDAAAADVLKTGVQYAEGADGTGKVRMVSSVADLELKNVGFKLNATAMVDVTAEDGTVSQTEVVTHSVMTQTRKVYQTIKGAGAVYTPSWFSANSQYMFAAIVKNIPADQFDTTLKATAYWETIDGVVVEGPANTFTLNTIK